MSGEQGFLPHTVYNTMQIQMRSHCPRGGYVLAPRRLTGIFVLLLLLPCAVVHMLGNGRQASLFPTRGIQLRGHELPEARVFTLYLSRSCQ
jgi:hypothetical protein